LKKCLPNQNDVALLRGTQTILPPAANETTMKKEIEMPLPVGSDELFAVCDFVKLSPTSEYEYEVAEIRRFPHGIMVGIYDEPPSEHVDFWNQSGLTLLRRAGTCSCGARRLDSGCYTSEPCEKCSPANSVIE
jgi:hypothetical protein